MFKYRPKVHLIETTGPERTLKKTFQFNYLDFIAVTAYQVMIQIVNSSTNGIVNT